MGLPGDVHEALELRQAFMAALAHPGQLNSMLNAIGVKDPVIERVLTLGFPWMSLLAECSISSTGVDALVAFSMAYGCGVSGVQV